MLAQRMALIARHGNPVRYAAIPQHTATAQNVLQMLMRAQMLRHLYRTFTRQGSRGSEGTSPWDQYQGPPAAEYMPTPEHQAMFQSLFESGDPGDLMALLDHLEQSGVPTTPNALRPGVAGGFHSAYELGLAGSNDNGPWLHSMLRSLFGSIAPILHSPVQSRLADAVGEQYESPQVHAHLAQQMRVPSETGMTLMSGTAPHHRSDSINDRILQVIQSLRGYYDAPGAASHIEQALGAAQSGHPRHITGLYDALEAGLDVPSPGGGRHIATVPSMEDLSALLNQHAAPRILTAGGRLPRG